MAKTLNLAEIFKLDADALMQSREKAFRIHGTNIKAAGNEVEQAVRNYLKRMLPPRYYVTNGHLVDPEGCVSPQLDVIIADNLNVPSLLTTEDGTEYVPVTSVFAIGEVKTTYYSSKHYYEKFHRVLSQINSELTRPLVENTAYGGMKPSTNMRDLYLGSPNKYLNNLYSFLLCVDRGDFEFEGIKRLLKSANPTSLPNIAVFLNAGLVTYAKRNNLGLEFHKYPIEVNKDDYDWCFMESSKAEKGSLEGTHLATLYAQLMSHLSTSHLDSPNAYRYTAKMSIFRRSSLIWAKDNGE